MKIVEKDRFRTRDISGHSLGRGDGASKGCPTEGTGCTHSRWTWPGLLLDS